MQYGLEAVCATKPNKAELATEWLTDQIKYAAIKMRVVNYKEHGYFTLQF